MKDYFNREARSALEQAIIDGNATQIKTLIDAGAVLDLTERSGVHALYWACSNRADIFKLLLPQVTNSMTYNHWSLLHTAATCGNLESLTLCLESGMAVNAFGGIGGYTPLHRAAEYGHALAVSALLAAGADPLICQEDSGFSVMHSAAMGHNPDVLRILAGTPAVIFINEPDSKKPTGKTPLELAISFKRDENIEPLLEAGALVNYIGSSGDAPLHHIMRLANSKEEIGQRLKIIKTLLDHGADIQKLKTKHLGDTPLHLAARDALDGEVIVAFLLKRMTGDVNQGNAAGETPLHYAAREGKAATVEILLKVGANPNAVTMTGVTPLYSAVTGNVLKSVDLLLNAGADPDIKTQRGDLLDTYAERTSIAELIQEFRKKKQTGGSFNTSGPNA